MVTGLITGAALGILCFTAGWIVAFRTIPQDQGKSEPSQAGYVPFIKRRPDRKKPVVRDDRDAYLRELEKN